MTTIKYWEVVINPNSPDTTCIFTIYVKEVWTKCVTTIEDWENTWQIKTITVYCVNTFIIKPSIDWEVTTATTYFEYIYNSTGW